MSRARLRLASQRAVEGDRGAALATVIGVAVVFGLLGAVLVATAVFASSMVTQGGAVSQAQAAADSAIDARVADLNGASGSDFRDLSWCDAETSSLATANGTAAIETTVVFFVKDGAGTSETCAPAADVEVTGARVTAEATVNAVKNSGTSTVKRAWVAEYDYAERLGSLLGGNGPTPFDHAIFSNENVNITNNFHVVGGVFTNKQINCSEDSSVQGPVTAVGSGSFTNQCVVDGDVWVGGKLTCSSKAKFLGSVFVAGGDIATVSNQCYFGGQLTANSKEFQTTTDGVQFLDQVTLTGRSWTGDKMNVAADNIADNTGSLVVSNKPIFKGHIQAVSARATDGKPMSSFMQPGKALALGTRSEPVKQPTPQKLPLVYAADVVGQAAFAVPDAKHVTLSEWVIEAATKNKAPSWSTGMMGSACEIAGANYSMNGNITVDVPTIVDLRGSTCSSLTFREIDVILNADLGVISPNGIVMSNKARFMDGRPTSETSELRLWLTVPVPDGITTTCSGGSKGDIGVNSNATIDTRIRTLIYTHQKVTLSNTFAMTGAIYACNQDLANMLNVYYKDPGFYNEGSEYCYDSEGDRWKPRPDLDEPCGDGGVVKYFKEDRRFAVGDVS